MAHVPHENRETGYETSDARPKTLLWLGLSVLVLVIGSVFLIYGLNIFYTGHPPKSSVSMPATTVIDAPPLPRLQLDPPLDMMRLNAVEDSILHNYGWADRDSGFAHIPIDRAMELVLERGLPVRRQDGAPRQTLPDPKRGNQSPTLNAPDAQAPKGQVPAVQK